MLNFVTYNRSLGNNVKRYTKISFHDYLAHELGIDGKSNCGHFISSKSKAFYERCGQISTMLDNQENPKPVAVVEKGLDSQNKWFSCYILNKEQAFRCGCLNHLTFVNSSNDNSPCESGRCKPQKTNPDAPSLSDATEMVEDVDKEGEIEEEPHEDAHDHLQHDHPHHDDREIEGSPAMDMLTINPEAAADDAAVHADTLDHSDVMDQDMEVHHLDSGDHDSSSLPEGSMQTTETRVQYEIQKEQKDKKMQEGEEGVTSTDAEGSGVDGTAAQDTADVQQAYDPIDAILDSPTDFGPGD